MQVIPGNHNVDILVTAAKGEPLLVAEIKRMKFDRTARDQISSYSKAVGANFVMAVDLEQILVAPTDNGFPDWKKAVSIPTANILRNYSEVSEFDRIEGFFLESLIESWLRDFSFSWKYKRPPGSDELERIGLASRLRNSETHVHARP